MNEKYFLLIFRVVAVFFFIFSSFARAQEYSVDQLKDHLADSMAEQDFISPPQEGEITPDFFPIDFWGLVGPGETEDERDARLGPWLNLKGGGIAVGDAQGVVITNPDGTKSGEYGALENASLVPSAGLGFKRAGSAAHNYASGFMLSLLENASAYIAHVYPGLVVHIGGISKQLGGLFPPHKSHQNGLDADLLFLGRTNWDSVLDKEGKVTERFDREKNWEFWRQLTAQQFFNNGKVESIVSMILVAPEIKQYLCAWAKETGAINDPLNFEVMRRLRPAVSHDDHFHLRLRCSPYHSRCEKSYAPPKVSGCEE